MSTPRVLTDPADGLDEPAVLAAVRAAFGELAAGRAVQPVQVVTDLPGGGDVIAYQAVLPDAGVYAVKVSPYLPQPAGKAVVTAWTLLLSTETGRPLVLADAAALTVERTAATTALAVDLLARPDARSLAVVGLGPVGLAHLRYARLVRDFDDVRVFARSAESAPPGTTLAASADAAAAGADVVLLCTSAAAPVVDVRALPPGTLVTSISTNAPRAHEIDPAALAGLDVYCDHAPAALASAGDFLIAGLEQVRGDLPGLLAGAAPPPSGDRPAYFRSVGLGIEDAAVALAALGGAR
jgi:L-arginine dehydrogenase